MLIQRIGQFPRLSSIPKLIALDTETHPDLKLEGYSFAYVENKKIKSYYVPVSHVFDDDEERRRYKNVDFQEAIRFLQKLCANRRIIFHNAQFDVTVLGQYDIAIENDNIEDTMLMHWLLDTERFHALKRIMRDEYNKDVILYSDAKLMGFQAFSKYGDDDARYTLFLYSKLQKEIKKFPNTFNLYRNWEIPFMRVMQYMNYYENYIRVDKDKLDRFQKLLNKEVELSKFMLKQKLGDINFNSTHQLAPALEKLGFEVRYNAPTKKMLEKARKKGETLERGNPSLGIKELIKLQKKNKKKGQVLSMLLYNRGLVKLQSTYIDSLSETLYEENGCWLLTGYSFNHTGARTGRLSSKDPNMQNQPRDKILMKNIFLHSLKRKKLIGNDVEFLFDSDLKKIYDMKNHVGIGKYEKHTVLLTGLVKACSIDIRDLFIAMPNKVLIGADYSQLELRMMAHFSKDPKMLYAYNTKVKDKKTGKMVNVDIHEETMRTINEMVGSEVLDRQSAKTTNFFLQYGGWIKSLAQLLGCKVETAKKIFYAFEKIYHVRAKWIKEVYVSARKSHFVQTILGRRRNINTIGINDYDEKSFARRNAAENASISTVVSGSSADLIKIAMVNIFENLHDVRLVLQVHDELLMEVDENVAEERLEQIKEYMENALTLNVPVVADAKIGNSWREVH
jgi:DNA polymerase-1